MQRTRFILIVAFVVSALCLALPFSDVSSSSDNGGQGEMEVAVMPDQQQFTSPRVPVIAVMTKVGPGEPDDKGKSPYLIKEVIVENRTSRNVSSVTIRWVIAPLYSRTTQLARGEFKPHVLQSLHKTLRAGQRQTLKLSPPKIIQMIEEIPNRESMGDKFVFLIGVAEVFFEDGSSWKEELTEVGNKGTPTN